MKTIITSLIVQCLSILHTDVNAQVQNATQLSPMLMSGDRLFAKNLSFGDYSTKKIRRTLGSYFRTRAIVPANALKIEGIPLYHKEKTRSKDFFHFTLNANGTAAAMVEVQAILIQNETFRLFRKQDSTFYGNANTDLLLGSVRLTGDTASWDIAAWNLNASKNEPQRGILSNGQQEITFEKTTLLVKEPGRNSFDTLFNGIHMVYAFRYNGALIAAVAYKDMEKYCWMNPSVNNNIKTVISSMMAVLRLRRNIYR